MYIKIYFNDKPLYLCNAIEGELEKLIHHDDAVFIDEFSGPAVKSMIHEMKTAKIHAGIFYHEDLDKLKKTFWKHFTIIQAGGGLVENEKHEWLLIFRRGKWDLPKGKLDKGETIEQCAIREVQEETGLQTIKLKDKITVTYHTYDEYGKHILKESHWYKMKASSKEEIIPQTTEDILEINWVKKDQLEKYLQNTYPSIAEVLKAV
ncbi:MAG: NUDIX domain-containing protein [Sphingobacteriales bacterium]|nr:NUDIX domain-containing protein [Sphingobacteriales bacterium]